MGSNVKALSLAKKLLSQPSAPFRESWVASVIRTSTRLPLYEDCFGNLWLNARNLQDVKQSRILFVAHMDHPGFIIECFEGQESNVIAKARWMGGGPMKIKGEAVTIFSEKKDGILIDGIVDSLTLGARSVATANLRIDSNNKKLKELLLLNRGNWGACLKFPTAVAQRPLKQKIQARAIDDLAGVCALMTAFSAAKEIPKGVTCLFSRAEEGGFHGTVAVLEKGWLSPQKTSMISVESSSALPGGESGGGPIIRLGDRSSVFNPGFVRWIQYKVAGVKGLQTQRRVMDGGSCEASAFNAYGFVVAGISIPLIGYHNVGSRNQAVTEEIATNDLLLTTKLISCLIEGASQDLRSLATPQEWHQLSFLNFRKDIKESLQQHLKLFV